MVNVHPPGISSVSPDSNFLKSSGKVTSPYTVHSFPRSIVGLPSESRTGCPPVIALFALHLKPLKEFVFIFARKPFVKTTAVEPSSEESVLAATPFA